MFGGRNQIPNRPRGGQPFRGSCPLNGCELLSALCVLGAGCEIWALKQNLAPRLGRGREWGVGGCLAVFTFPYGIAVFLNCIDPHEGKSMFLVGTGVEVRVTVRAD